MTNATLTEQNLAVLLDTFKALVARDDRDLNVRQLAVFLTCYLDNSPHTVRELSASMRTSKPAITRALDRLGGEDVLQRKIDPQDRRSVLTQRTTKGSSLLRDLRKIMEKAAAAGEARAAGAAKQKTGGGKGRPARSRAA